MIPQKSALLREAEAAFRAKTYDLPPGVLELRLRAMAAKSIGTGAGQIDPIEQALARRALDFLLTQKEAVQVDEAAADLSRNPPPRMSRAEQLEELEKLEHRKAALVAKAITIADRPLGSAVNEAAALRQEAEQVAARQAAIRSAAEAKAAERAADPHAVDALAATLASRK